MTPLYIIEEHHEAFYIWNKAALAGHLPPFGNTLLHIDRHTDFECGAYAADFGTLFSSLEAISDFTYNYLGIADFICPAIYQGLFNEVVIVKDYSIILPAPQQRLVRIDGNGCLEVDNLTVFSRAALSKPEAEFRLFTYREGGLGNFSTPQEIALDIDIDYFCWDDSLSTVQDKRLEITETAYRELTGNPYHPFRLLPKAWLRPEEDGGRFYLSYIGLPSPGPLPEWEQVQKRINAFKRWLERNKVNPCMISVCRSRYSGYTPATMWADVENELLVRLGEVYELDTQS